VRNNMKLPLALLAFYVSIAGCSGGGGASGGNATTAPPATPPPMTTTPPTTPPALAYDGSHSLEIGVLYGASITADLSVTGASVSPALPQGLTLSSRAIVTGSPTALSAPTTYTFTVSNSNGSSTMAVQLEVVGGPIFYATPVLAPVGAAMPPLVPTLVGAFKNFRVTPQLPAGLQLNAASGVISGTPVNAAATRSFEITASGQLSDVTFGILLGVTEEPGATVSGVFRDPKASGLIYRSGTLSGITDQDGRFFYQTGQPITFSVGAVELGTVTLGKSVVTPVDLLANGSGNSTYVINVVRFLSMLDQDGDLTNGIQISAGVTAAAAHWAQLDFTTIDLPSALAPLVSDAIAADGGTHVLPDAAAAKSSLASNYYCTYSGGFVGTYRGTSPDSGYGLIAIAFTPDGVGNVHTDDLASNTGLKGNTGIGLSSLDGSFQVDLAGTDPTSISGTFSGTDRVEGSFQSGADIKHFSAARIGGSPDAYQRYSGGFSSISYPAGFAAIDADAAGHLTGVQYRFGTGFDPLSFAHLSTFTGALSGTTASVFITSDDVTGRYNPQDLTFFAGDPYDTEPGLFENGSSFFQMQGCRLN
jgi:hypothetical protein